MKKILIMVNRDFVLYNFRIELVERLLAEGYRVYISLPYGGLVEEMERMGCEYVNTPINRRSINLVDDVRLFFNYLHMIGKIKPDYVLTYTIKPNIYGTIAAAMYKIPCLMNISGLGTAIKSGGLLQKFVLLLYRIAAGKARRIFFQNNENMSFITSKKIGLNKSKLLPGSGVNLDKFQILPYPPDDTVRFLFIGRVMREKGIEEYLEAARRIRKKYANTQFHILGPSDEGYQDILEQETKRGTIFWHGMVPDIREYIWSSHCTIHPSWHEGMSNALLESAACGRPVIATDISGCREVIAEGVTGLTVKVKDINDLAEKIERFLQLPFEVKRQMGLAGRNKVEGKFDRRLVVEEYMREIYAGQMEGDFICANR